MLKVRVRSFNGRRRYLVRTSTIREGATFDAANPAGLYLDHPGALPLMAKADIAGLPDGEYTEEQVIHAFNESGYKFEPFPSSNSAFNRAYAVGHKRRNGHELTGYHHGHEQDFALEFVKTCCNER